MKVVAIVQARMGGIRLPGKVLKNLAGEPMLSRIMRRLLRSKLVDDVIVATSVEAQDNPIISACTAHGWAYFRGSEADVLDRYYKAAEEYDADAVVRITADRPFVDPELVDKVLYVFCDAYPEMDYVSNSFPVRTYPLGMDVEVISMKTLQRIWNEDDNPAWREHVTVFVKCHPGAFQTEVVQHGHDCSHMRWTVDTEADLAFARQIYDYFESDLFTWLDVLEAVEEHPEWARINEHILQKTTPR